MIFDGKNMRKNGKNCMIFGGKFENLEINFWQEKI